jgi:hypothetical protein
MPAAVRPTCGVLQTGENRRWPSEEPEEGLAIEAGLPPEGAPSIGAKRLRLCQNVCRAAGAFYVAA